jgi:hypothetical protein
MRMIRDQIDICPHRLPRTAAWRRAGKIAPQPGTANFPGRAADGRQQAAEPAAAADGRPQVIDRQRGIAALAAP